MSGQATKEAACWLKISGEDSPEISQDMLCRVERRISAGEYSSDDVKYIEKLSLRLAERSLQISDGRLEKLRRLCQLWEVDLRPGRISSHRKFVGPLIVAAKRLCLPVLRALFKDTLRQQRDFNAAVISLLAEISNEGQPPSHDSVEPLLG